MIVPVRTEVPVETFTPSRCEAESRPLREEAAPFFFDIPAEAYLLLLGRPLLGRRLLGRGSLLGRLVGRGALRCGRPAGAAGRDRGDLDQRVPLAVPPS